MNLEPVAQLVFYDDLGRVEKQSQPHYTSEVNNEHWTEFTYDLLGRETLRDLPYTNTYASGNAVVSTFYNVDQNQRKQTQTTPATEGAPTGSKKHTVVNALGQTIGIVDTNGHTLAYGYNARGNLIKTEATGVHGSNALEQELVITKLVEGDFR